MTLLLFLVFPLAWGEVGRLDPHGRPQTDLRKVPIAKHSECRVCHQGAPGHWKAKPDAGATCVSCHSKQPHSGIAEHAKAGVACLDCHLPHRSGAKSFEVPRSILGSLERPKLPPGFVRKHHLQPMLRKTCTECHAPDRLR